MREIENLQTIYYPGLANLISQKIVKLMVGKGVYDHHFVLVLRGMRFLYIYRPQVS